MTKTSGVSLMNLKNANFDIDPSPPVENCLLSQLAAVLCPPTVQAPISSPSITDIVIQLSEAVSQAKKEAEHERNLRLALELENQSMRTHQQSELALSPSVSLSLSECLSIVSASPYPELVYMSYYNSGLAELDMLSVEAVYEPFDLVGLVFVIFRSYSSLVPAGLIPYSLDNLKSLVAGSPTLAASEDADEPPRMNLLEALSVETDADCERIVTVRKCHKLGFKSQTHLRQYFSKFGRVDRVVLLPMRAKPKNALDGRSNRPSSMGFVVMETKEAAERILSHKNHCGVHEIKGWPIEVRNFVRPADKPSSIDRDISTASTAVW